MTARLVAALAALLSACALLAPAALADGDPASDTLITDRIFYPYSIKLPAAGEKALAATIAKVTAKGYPVRVALIAHDYDLGSAGLLYRKPKLYAKFLAQELAQFNTGWVLVVMPNGYGIYHCVPKQRVGYADPCEGGRPTGPDERALAALATVDKGRTDYAAAADTAVRKLAALHGASLGGGIAKLLIGVVVVLALLGAGAVLLLRRRRQPKAT